MSNYSLYIASLLLGISSLLYFAFKDFVSRILNRKSLPVLLWWTAFMPNDDRIISCENEKYKCLLSSNRSKLNKSNAVLFYGSHIESHDFPLPRYNIPWAIFHEESPKNYAPFLYEDVQGLFNITSTFSRNSTFPITLQYLDNINELKDKKYYVPINIKNSYLESIAPVLYVQSDCDTPSDRDALVKELQNFIRIDSYGKCLKNKEFPKQLSKTDPLDLYHEDYMYFISKYKFIIAFENAICYDYITEKLWRPLIVGSIPIYLGSPTVEDWLPNNNSAILVKNFENIKQLGEFINKLNKNDSLYESYLEHKLLGEISNKLLENSILEDDPILAFECFVCKKIHKFVKGEKSNVYNCLRPSDFNSWHQHWQIGKCQAKALEKLISKGESYTKESFEKTWLKLFHEENC